jgi:hypothetical protein
MTTRHKHLGRGPTRAVREIVRLIEQAKGTVEPIGRGHIKVIGPDGWTVIPGTFSDYPRARENIYTKIRKRTGLDVRQVRRQASRQASRQARRGRS